MNDGHDDDRERIEWSIARGRTAGIGASFNLGADALDVDQFLGAGVRAGRPSGFIRPARPAGVDRTHENRNKRRELRPLDPPNCA